MKRWPTSGIMSKLQIKTTMKYTMPPMGIIKIQKYTTRCWQGCETTGTLIHWKQGCKNTATLEVSLVVSYKNKHTFTT